MVRLHWLEARASSAPLVAEGRVDIGEKRASTRFAKLRAVRIAHRIRGVEAVEPRTPLLANAIGDAAYGRGRCVGPLPFSVYDALRHRVEEVDFSVRQRRLFARDVRQAGAAIGASLRAIRRRGAGADAPRQAGDIAPPAAQRLLQTPIVGLPGGAFNGEE